MAKSKELSQLASVLTVDTGQVTLDAKFAATAGTAQTDFITKSQLEVAVAGKDNTDEITEGSTNLYYTSTRANADFDTRLATKSTSNLAEGTNLYYTDARFDTRLATKSTTNLAEGTNLYYTSTRANADFDTRLATKSTTNLAEGTNLYYTDARFDTRLATKSTSNLAEGTNLYYTDARVGSYLTTNSYATQTYVNTAVSNLVDSAPGALDTLNELAAALNDDANYATTVTNALAGKLSLTGGTLSGNLTVNAQVIANSVNPAEIVNSINRPTIRPSLSLDFANSKEVDKRITFTRSTSATYYDKNGVLQYAIADQPRIDHDPVTKECKGLLIEEQRTNLLLSNHDVFAYTGCHFGGKVMAPDGTMTATFVEEDNSYAASGSYLHYWWMDTDSYTSSIPNGATFALSFYAKPVGRQTMDLGFDGSGAGGAISGGGTLNFSTQTVTNGTGSITSVGNGWYRVVLIGGNGTGATVVIQPYAYITASGTNLYSASAGNGFYIWGCQVEIGAFATSLIPVKRSFTSRASGATYFDSTGILRYAGTNQARYGYEYDSASSKWMSRGLILESAATNIHDAASFDGLSATLDAGISPDGKTTATLLTETSNNVQHNLIIRSNAGVTLGGTYTFSIFIKPDTLSGNAFTLHHHGGSSYTYDLSTNTTNVQRLPNGWYRVWATFVTATNVGNFYVNPNITLGAYAGNTGRRYYYWGAQIEEGTVATSLIPTFGAAVTRAADVSSSAATTRAADSAIIYSIPWYNPLESTLYGEGYSISGNSNVGSNPALASIDDGTSNQRFIIRRYSNANDNDNSGFTFRLYTLVNGTAYSQDAFPAQGVLPEWDDTAKHKMAFAIAENTQIGYADGINANITSITCPPYRTPTQMTIGYGGSSAYWNGHISKIAYYPKRLSNTELQAITK